MVKDIRRSDVPPLRETKVPNLEPKIPPPALTPKELAADAKALNSVTQSIPSGNTVSGPAKLFAAKPARGKSVKESPPPPTRYTNLLKYGIRSYEDLALAFQLLTELGPPWKNMVDTMERLREARIQEGAIGTAGLYGESFAIVLNGKGTFSARGVGEDRETELSSGITLETGVPIFALIHELTHALPLTALPPEMAALPYDSLPIAFDLLSFEKLYDNLINQYYHDEAISVFAEIQLYRELKQKGFIQEEETSPEDPRLEQGSKILEKDGIPGYLQSECYIGRNHRVDYNKARLASLAFFVSLEPEKLGKYMKGATSILEENGITVGDEALQKNLSQIEALIQNPTLEGAAALLMELKGEGIEIKLDVATLIQKVGEAAALVAGTQQKASASFFGKKPETEQQVKILAESRRIFDRYLERFEASSGEWKDTEGLI
ncbi:MAG: hypothetical protein Q7S00_01020, partial [bacterium]|nr:hypothetical protein [bacterium]